MSFSELLQRADTFGSFIPNIITFFTFTLTLYKSRVRRAHFPFGATGIK